MHLAVISIAPRLVLSRVDISSVVTRHGSSYMHYYCIETVMLISLETIRSSLKQAHNKSSMTLLLWQSSLLNNIYQTYIFWLPCSKNRSAECFRKSNFVVEFPGEAIVVSESFQVDTQNRRQWDKFHFLHDRKKIIKTRNSQCIALCAEIRLKSYLKLNSETQLWKIIMFSRCAINWRHWM